jgi:MinD-like ATPase involved in chromosome partitioning or flagellar assembly
VSAPESRGAWDTDVLRRLGPAVSRPAAEADAPPETSEEPPAEPDSRPARESPWESRPARRLAKRSGTGPWRRRLAVLSGVLRSDDEPDRRTEDTARCQTAVSTGRRVAVLAAHGGAGATTLTAGLGMMLAAVRSDYVAVLAGRPDRQVLQRRLGCEQPSSMRAARDLLVAHQVDPNVASLDHLAVPGRTRLRAVTQSDDADVVVHGADHLSRLHAVTLVDVGPVTDHPVLDNAHGVVVVGRLSVDGVAQVHQVLGELADRVPLRRLQVVLVETGVDSGVPLAVAHTLLEAYDVAVSALPSDRHLATGTTISLALLSDAAAGALTEIAAHALDIVTARP